MAAPLSFGFKRSFKATDAVKRKEPESNKVFISEFGEETEGERVSEELVIPKQENSFRPGVKNTFVPRFVPLVLSSKEQLNSEERFEAAEVKETTQEVHYGLQPRDGGVVTSTASDFVSESELPEKESLEAFRAEVRALPDEADGAAYERMPVEAFGLAMLKGMDWKEGQVLGKNKDKKAVEAIEFVPRASRLGLGAAPNGAKKKRGPVMVLPTGSDGKVRHVRTLDEKLVPYEESEMKVGDQRRIASGDHQGFQCTIVRVTDSKGEVLVRLPNDEEICVQLRDLIPIDRSIEDAPASPVTKRKKQKREMTSAEVNGKTSWLMTGMRVRIVDKRLDNGQLYLKKGVIVDIVRPGVANLLLDHSHVLKESLKESSLESVVPRGDAAVVLVVKGEFRGSKGKLLQRNSDQEMATIQLLSDLSVHRMSFDYVSEYIQP